MSTIGTQTAGFSLTELAVVMVIIALLIGGMLMPFQASQENQGRAATEKQLAEIREALIGYALINGRLPCPAQASIATGDPNAGLEATTGSGAALVCACNSSSGDIATQGTTACPSGSAATVTGVLPWATLGLTEQDAWGNRYTYRVTTFFARGLGQATFGCPLSSNPTQAAFALCSSGSITILDKTGGSTLASGLPAVVVSHGKNGLGAYLPSGSQIAGAANDELGNTGSGSVFINNTNIDDQITWISPNTLMSRMLAAGKLP